jgi:hypothetical protein
LSNPIETVDSGGVDLTGWEDASVASSTALPVSISRTGDLGLDEYDENAPANELDEDGDDYVECSYSAAIWSASGSRLVIGGDDCLDKASDATEESDTTYPEAT